MYNIGNKIKYLFVESFAVTITELNTPLWAELVVAILSCHGNMNFISQSTYISGYSGR